MINIWAVLLCTVITMALGAIWYGPLFGNLWLRTIGATAMDLAQRAAMQRRAAPLYAVQTVLAALQLSVLAYAIYDRGSSSGIVTAFWVWLAFVMPTVAAGAMWNNDDARTSWTRFGIQAGYQLVTLVLCGLILDLWR